MDEEDHQDHALEMKIEKGAIEVQVKAAKENEADINARKKRKTVQETETRKRRKNIKSIEVLPLILDHDDKL